MVACQGVEHADRRQDGQEDLVEIGASSRGCRYFRKRRNTTANDETDPVPPVVYNGQGPSLDIHPDLPSQNERMTDLPRSGTLTFLFTDLEASTRLWEQFPEAMRPALARHDALLHNSIETHRGRIVKRTGDGLHAVFESALDGVAAALAAQEALLAEPWPEETGPLRVRMGLHTGESEAREGDYYGSEVNRAARLMSIGHGGQVLLSNATALLVRDQLPPDISILDLGEHGLHDLGRAERIFQLAYPGLPSEFPALKSLSAYRHNLPVQLGPFVGRQKELAEVKRLLGETRLLTLLGPGGTGKTRLSLQAAAELLDEYDDGIFFVDLTVLSDPAHIVSTIAETLSVRELRTEPILITLRRNLQGKQLLLLLDNFEHLMEGASVIGELIAAAPEAGVLVTSREALRLSGETTYPVPPLGLPETAQPLPLRDLAKFESVELFVRRARAANHTFELTAQNAEAVAEICRQLDGLPLAIELAAARARTFTPKKLLERLSDRLALLSRGVRNLPARQQTLRSAIDWSYELLDDSERALFARLAVFSGGGSLEAVEVVCGAEPGYDVLDDLESLLDKSMIRQEGDFEGLPRFTMLETLQAYASERLSARPDRKTTLAAHADWVLAFAERAEQGLFGDSPDVWTKRLQSEEGNLRAVLDRCESGRLDPEIGVRLAGKLRYYWETTGKLSEGRAWLKSMLSISTGAPEAERVNAVCGAGVLAYWQGDWSESAKWCNQALETGRDLGDRFIIGEAQHFLGHVCQHDGDYQRGLNLLRESLKKFMDLAHPWGILRARNCLADAERLAQNYELAASNFEEIIQMYRSRTKDVLFGAILSNYGNVLNRQGEYRRALASFQKGIEFAHELENTMLLGFLFDGLAGTAILTDQPDRSARLMGISKKAFEMAGVTSLNVIDQFDHDFYLSAIQENLHGSRFDELLDEGYRMPLEKAVAYALDTRVRSGDF